MDRTVNQTFCQRGEGEGCPGATEAKDRLPGKDVKVQRPRSLGGEEGFGEMGNADGVRY